MYSSCCWSIDWDETGAETLRSTKIKATPFISEYRIAALIICVLLFVVEAIIDYFRITAPSSSFSHIIITIVIYLLVSLALTVCYIICCYSILKRVTKMVSGRAKRVRKMSLRFVMSSTGYILIVLFELLIYGVHTRPWGPQIVYNLLFASLALTTTLQVWALKPINTRKSSHSSGGTVSQALSSV